MPTMNSGNTEIKICDKKGKHLGNVKKIEWTYIKGKGEPFPKAATVHLYDVKMIEGDDLPPCFDIKQYEDNGLYVKEHRLCNCEPQGQVEGKIVAIATANDTSFQKG